MKEDFWKGRNVFLTGANGFVGTWLAKALVDKGATVIALIRDIIPESPLEYMAVSPKLSAIVYGTTTDYDVVERTFNEYAIDTCFHLAAQAITTAANQSPPSTFESNIKGTWNVLEAARNSKTLQRIVVASSDKAYGEHDKLPYKEDFPLLASHPYDASKACTDILARTYWNTYDLPVAVSRCANIYGGGDLNFSRIVPDTIRAVLYDKRPVIRSDGTPIRDYMYVSDAVDAYLLLAERIDNPKVTGEAFNFGTEEPVSVLELVDKIIQASGKTSLEPVIKGTSKMAGEIDKQYLSITKARSVLGWDPKYDLEDGLLETISWYGKWFQDQGRSNGV